MADKKYISDCGGVKKAPKLPKNLNEPTIKKNTQSKNTSKGKK